MYGTFIYFHCKSEITLPVSISRSRGKNRDERESSVCRDVDVDPSPMKRQATKESEQIKK